MQTAPPAVELRAITKRFGPTVANDAVDFAARPGEVHALVGENGAGKSTLMSVLAGLYRPDAGTLLVGGRPVAFRAPRDAIAAGIGMVHQHFMLVDPFTVAENATLGEPGRRYGLGLATGEVERELTRLAERYSLAVDPRARVWQLSVGEQQRVEILRLLYRGARVLVLDEPTAVLTPQEAAGLVRTLRGLAAEGAAVVFISHKLDEVLAVADRVTVLRRGRTVATLAAAATDRRELARLMVGRDPTTPAANSGTRPSDAEREALGLGPAAADRPHEVHGAAVLEIRGLRADSDRGLPALAGIDLEVRAGEILGVAGVAGNGQRELVETIAGLRRPTAGRVRVGGTDATGRSPRAVAALGVAHVPEDRLGTGLVPGLDLTANAILRAYRRPPLARGPFLAGRAIATFADGLIRRHDVKAPGRSARLRTLSGGNQQKLLLGRELAGEPRLLLAVHPTRGVDIGATGAIHRQLLDQRDRGAAVLLVSEDLDELLALADRVAVLHAGRVMGTLPAAGADPEHLGLLMAGVDPATQSAPTTSVPAGGSTGGSAGG